MPTKDAAGRLAAAIELYMTEHKLKGVAGQDAARKALRISNPKLFADYAAEKTPTGGLEMPASKWFAQLSERYAKEHGVTILEAQKAVRADPDNKVLIEKYAAELVGDSKEARK